MLVPERDALPAHDLTTLTHGEGTPMTDATTPQPPTIGSLVAQGASLLKGLESAAGAAQPPLKAELAGMASEVEDILIRLAGLMARR